jgi:uncharacterized protein
LIASGFPEPKSFVHPAAFFLPATSAEGGQRFCLFHSANDTTDGHRARPKGLILYLHPFAEEMNKSRRMAAIQARVLANAGYSVLQIDLLGCGDSSGDFGDATWDAWIQDVALGLSWLRQHAGAEGQPLTDMPVWLWGLRAGCLLAVDAAKRIGEPLNFLFWQPPASGKALLQQFLRLKIAGDLGSGQGKTVMDEMRKQLGGGGSVEIGGYSLASGLANGLESSLLDPGSLQTGGRVEWLEVSTRENAELSPVAAKTIEFWQSQGFQVHGVLARGPAFWQTNEIEDAPDLIAETLKALKAEEL